MIYVPCNLCGRDEWELRFPATIRTTGAPDGKVAAEELDATAFRCTSSDYGRHAQIVQCRHCSHVYANPRWSSDELLQAYGAVQDQTYVVERSGRQLTFLKHLQAMEKVTGPAQDRSLLDVGAYIGVFVEVALAAGWQACGVEPSKWAATVARKEGLPVIQGTQYAPELHGRQFDVITMWDVIEHVNDPAAELRHAFDLLKPGGFIVVHTMDIDSLAARLMGPRWPWLMGMHIHYFSRRTLAQMLRNNGFDIIWSGAQGRYLRMGYLATRVAALNRLLGAFATALVTRVGLNEVSVPVNFGDLFTIYARRPEHEAQA